MPSITEQIQTLVEQGSTEEALETLANWLRTEQSLALNEVILLRSRYEQVQRELGLDLISPEDAARSYNQISFSLLNLLQSVEKGTPTAIPIAAQNSNRNLKFAIVAGAVVLAVIAFFFINRLGSSGRETSISKATALKFPQGKEVSLTMNSSTATYTILEAKTEPYKPENQKITLKIRCFLKGRYDINFWESDFRLVANELPYPAQGGLNELVQSDSFKDGEVYFLIPKDLRKADLRIKFYEEYTVLPVQW